MFTIIDLEDLDILKNCPYTWSAAYNKNAHGYYAVANVYDKDENGKTTHTTQCLHTFLENPELNPEIVVDHRNHDMLDNRRCNLRATENKLNLRNRSGKNRNNKSGYRNVCWNKGAGKWQVSLCKNRQHILIGMFDDLDEAGIVAENARKQYYGEYAGKN